LKIAFISTILGYPWGGADTLWTHAAEAASARGDALFISVSPAVAASPRIRALIDGGARALTRVQPDRLTLPLRVLRKLRLARTADARLIAALRSFRPDVVIFSQGGTYDVLLHRELVSWLQETGVKYRLIANWQEENPFLDDDGLAFAKAAFKAAEHVHFVSTRNLAVTRRHLGLPLANASVIQNPLRWRPSDTPPWPAGAITNLATVSRLDEGKGIQLLLQALAGGDESLPDWQLNIYGQGPYESALRTLAAQPALANRVHFRGYVPRLREIWAVNHLLVSPAINDGVPMTIPEAMLCQRPVLATCVGGAEDWLRDGETGFLCATPTVTALGHTLRRALTARNCWADMGLAAATAAHARYLPEDYHRLLTP
jgi:L-malate glycosyltransferase